MKRCLTPQSLFLFHENHHYNTITLNSPPHSKLFIKGCHVAERDTQPYYSSSTENGLEQHSSYVSVYTNLGGLATAQTWIQWSGVGPRFCISNALAGDASAAASGLHFESQGPKMPKAFAFHLPLCISCRPTVLTGVEPAKASFPSEHSFLEREHGSRQRAHPDLSCGDVLAVSEDGIFTFQVFCSHGSHRTATIQDISTTAVNRHCCSGKPQLQPDRNASQCLARSGEFIHELRSSVSEG